MSHPTWFTVPQEAEGGSDSGGTLQGRITCKKGKHQTDPPSVQAAYRSRWYGGIIIKADASQAELRTAALLSGEPTMLKAYALDHAIYLGKPRSDLHTDRTVQIFGPSILEDPHYGSGVSRLDPRQVGKTVNFADLFRAGALRMQRTVYDDLGLFKPLSFYQRIVDSRPSDRPALYAWQESLIEEARRTGRLQLPFTGQSRYFEGGTKFDENEIVNMPVQTTANNALLRIQNYFNRATFSNPRILCFLNVFDALLIDCRTQADADEAISILEEALIYVSNHEYWAWLQDLTGNTCPLVLEVHKKISPS